MADQFWSWVAAFAVFGLIILAALAPYIRANWLRDKPYKREDGVLVPCGCRGCAR